MTPKIARREPNTLLIYGAAAGVIAVWWAMLWSIGMTERSDGRVMLIAIAIPALLVAFFRDPFGMLCLIVFSLPFSLGVLQVEIGIITFSPYTMGVIGALCVAFAGVLFGQLRFRPVPEDLLALLLGFSFLLSTLGAKDITEGGYLAFHGVFIPIVTYFVVKILVRTPEQYRKIIIAFVAGITVFALYGLIQFALQPQRLKILNMSSISAAALMTSALIVVFYSGWWRHVLGKLTVLLLLPALVTTFARGYLVLLLLTPLFYVVFRRGRGVMFISVMLIGSLIGTLIFSQMPGVFEPGNADRGAEQTAERLTDLDYWKQALYGRAIHYAEGLEKFAESPILGNGFHMGSDKQGVRAIVWHNFHVEWLEYGGLMGYLLYILLLFVHFSGVSRRAKFYKLVAVNLTVMVTILLNGLTNSFTAGLSPYIGFFFMALNRVSAQLTSEQNLEANRNTLQNDNSKHRLPR